MEEKKIFQTAKKANNVISPLEPLRFMSDRKERPIFEFKTLKYCPEDKGDVDSILKADENPADFMTPTEPVSKTEIQGLGSAGLRLAENNSITRQASVNSKRDEFRNRLR
jgi:hypothetical protein